MNFGPQVLPEPELMCRETLRILKPSGVAGFTSWSQFGWHPSIKAVFPDFTLPPGLENKWTSSKVVTQTMIDLGFKDVVVTTNGNSAKMSVKQFTDVMEIAIPMLKEEGKKEKYVEYLMGQADAQGEVDMYWEALIATGKK